LIGIPLFRALLTRSHPTRRKVPRLPEYASKSFTPSPTPFKRNRKVSFGFTGTRQGMTAEQKSVLRNLLGGGAGEFHHGDCIGADSEGHDIADECG
jgi:hypothetical protein